MKIFLTLVLAAIIMLGLLFTAPALILILMGMGEAYAQTQSGNAGIGKPIAGEYTVWLDEDTPENFVDRQAEIINDTIKEQGGNITSVMENLKAVNIQGISNPYVLLNVSNSSSVKTIEPIILQSTERQFVPAGIARAGIVKSVGADVDNRESRPDIDIAVLDTGVWGTGGQFHPDLNVVQRINFEPSAYVGQGFDSHGTHTSGSCCAKDNLGGVVSASPGARIWNLIICDGYKNAAGTSGTCNHGGSTLAAFDWLVAHSATIEIATMSVGGGSLTSSMNNAITDVWNSGITLFVSAGNENADTQGRAYCSATNVICVSALGDSDGKCGGLGPIAGTSSRFGETRDDERASFSNFGSEVDVMAPGVTILSTWPGHPDFGPGANAQYIGNSELGKYAAISGTSMATPIAAGVGGLIKTLNPSFTPNQVKSSMQSNAYSQTLACDTTTGKGGLRYGPNSGSSEKILYAGNY